MNFEDHRTSDYPRRIGQNLTDVDEFLNVDTTHASPTTLKEETTGLSYYHAGYAALNYDYPGHVWNEERLRGDFLASQVQFEHAPQSSPYIDYYASVEADLIPPQVGWTIQADFRKSSIAPVFVQQSNGPGTSIAERTWGDCPSRTCFHPHPTALQTFALSPPARAEVFMPIAGFASHMSPSALVDAYQAVQHVPLLNVSFSHYPISHITPPTNVLLDHGAWSPEDPSSIPPDLYPPLRTCVSPQGPPTSFTNPRSDPAPDTAAASPSTPNALDVPTSITPTPSHGVHSPIISASPPARSATAEQPSQAARRLKCPICGFVQKTSREVDMKRHMKRHATHKERWECYGLPLGEGEEGARRRRRMGDGKVRELGGVKLFGGCGEHFSRRDGLQKHLRRPLSKCVGDPHAAWYSGNAPACLLS